MRVKFALKNESGEHLLEKIDRHQSIILLNSNEEKIASIEPPQTGWNCDVISQIVNQEIEKKYKHLTYLDAHIDHIWIGSTSW